VIDGLSGDGITVALFHALRPSGLAMSIITYVEIFEGILGSRDPVRAEQTFRAFLRGTAVIGIDQAVAERAAAIWANLRGRQRPVTDRAMDILIAATAIKLNLTLMSRNVRDCHDIPRLRLFNGTSA